VIYTDFKKAFDKVFQNRLISYLGSYGIDREAATVPTAGVPTPTIPTAAIRTNRPTAYVCFSVFHVHVKVFLVY